MRTYIAAGIALTLLCAAPWVAASADTDPRDGDRHHHMEDRAAIFDARLAGFKAGLGLKADQEAGWSTFESAVRAIAKSRQEWRRQRDEAKDDDDARPSPIERMREMSDRLGRRSSDLKTLADAAAPLYASLDDKQKMVFRVMGRELMHGGRHGGGRHRED
jgi:zinc resistance-associated protein